MFSRIAVINRGEPAVRLIRAVRELNAEFGYGIKVIALHTQAERGALFVRLADEGVVLRDKGDLGSPYLDHAELERAMIAGKVDACWPGWGFVSEDAGFVEVCDRIGVTFIGPPAAAMRKLGDKVQAKYLAEATGVPVAPWSGGPVEDMASALEHAKQIGYPMILKARSGGGGRGIRMVFDPSELEEAIERTQSEALKAFNDQVIFMEKLVVGGRHIEVQVIADNYGNAWAPGIRDCSIQRRNQKLIEESGSPALTREQDIELRRGAVALVKEAGYRGAGTVEFLYQPEEKMFAFLEVNTRLQVEHSITELSTGLDLVKLQIMVADGHRLEGDPPPNFGYAIEARLNAEDADNGFAPSPGKVELLTLPVGPGIRVDTGIATGDEISPDYDSMIAKIIAWGRDRDESMARLRVALRSTTVVVRNGTTTKSFLLELLDHPEVINGTADTGWLDRAGLTDQARVAKWADAALLYVGVDVYEAEEALERDSFLRSARGGRPRAGHTVGREVELGYLGQTYTLNVAQISPNRYRIEIGGDGKVVEVEIDRMNKFESRLTVGDRRHHVVASTTPSGYLVEVDSVTHRISRDEGGVVRSPAPAVVVAVRAAAGTDVEAGDTVMILESMKMETPVRAPYAGRVREILVGVNAQVDGGGALLRIDRIDDDAAASTTPTVEFETGAGLPADDLRGRALADLAAMRALVMGYDVSAARGRALLADYDQVRNQTQIDDPELLRASLGVLSTFADICELSRNRPAGEEEAGDERVHSPREYFHSYLHSLDLEREGLPEAFRTRVAAVLANYGVTDLEPSPELEDAVFRVFLAQERAADQVPIIAGLLERWRKAVPGFTPDMRQAAGEVVERLVVATRLRFPVIGDLARSLRYEAYERPLIDEARQAVYDDVREQLRLLAANPSPAEYAERIDKLVASPEPLIRLLAQQLTSNGPGLDAALEAMVRRYYRIRELENVKAFRQDGRSYVTGQFRLSGDRLELISALADYDDLPGALVALNTMAEQADQPANVVTDLYLAWPEAPDDGDQLSTALHGALVHQSALAAGRRITVTVCRPGENPVQQFTFRPSADGLTEERVIRNMHPLTGQRLDLWRLKNFNGTRMPSAEGTYLFHLVAPNNSADERLVALAEVRDVTPLRDGDGKVVAFPSAERVLAACLESIRRVQAQRSGRQRLDDNRVFLHVWPPIEVPLSDLAGFAQMSTPLTLGTGLAEIMVLARLRQDDGSLKDVAMRFAYQAGAGVTVTVSDPPTDAAGPAGRVHPEGAALRGSRHGVPVRDRAAAHRHEGHVHRVRLRRRRHVRAGGPAARAEQGGRGCRSGGHPDGEVPGGHHPGGDVRRPDQGAGHGRGRGVRDRGGRHRPGRGVGRAGGVVHPVLRREDLDGQRHREHGRGGPGAAPDHHVHPGRRRGEHHRGRHQRRRPAVLERRGDDADAHQGHPGDDAGQRHGADREDVAGLLRRCLGGGQLRPRRLRPGDGPERRGAVLGAEPHRGDGDPVRALRPRLRRARRAVPAPGGDDRSAGPGRADLPARAPGQPVHHGGGDLLAGDEQGPEEAVRHPDGDQRDRRPGSRDPGTVGRDGRRGHLGGGGRAPGRLPGGDRRDRVAEHPAARVPAGGRPGSVHLRARCSRSRRRRRPGRSTRPAAAGRWWCWRTCPGSTAPRSRCGTSSWSTAPRSAGPS